MVSTYGRIHSMLMLMQGPWCLRLQEALGNVTPSTLGWASFQNGRVRMHAPHRRRLAWSPPRAARKGVPRCSEDAAAAIVVLVTYSRAPSRARAAALSRAQCKMAQSCILSELREAGARAEPGGRQPMGTRACPLARQRRVVNPAPAAAARSAASSLLHSPGRPRILRLPAPLRRPPWTKVSLLIYQIFSGCLKIRTLPGGCFFWTTQTPAYIVTIFF